MKTSISYEEFLERVEKYHLQFQNKGIDWRRGQTYFIVLSSVRSDIAETIRGTIYDPFHKDDVSHEIQKYVKSLWE